MQSSSPSQNWNPWPVSIVAFFVIALIGCGSFVAFCSRHPADLVASDYYEREVRFQKQIDRVQRTQQQATVALVSYEASKRRITIDLPPAPAETKIIGQIHLYRPSAANLDKTLPLEPDASGTQTIDAQNLLPGLWKVRVSWRAGGQDYYIEQSVVVGAKQA